jgi:lactoylglutathione lyase
VGGGQRAGQRAGRSGTKKAAPAPARAPHSGSGLAPGMQALNSYLAVANIGATMEFLERAFGFARGVVLPDPDGQPRYAEMRHGDSVVMLIRKGDPATASGGVGALYAYVDDVDRAIVRARDGGAGVGEAEDKPWGDRVATVTDPDGYRWVLATFKKLAPFG